MALFAMITSNRRIGILLVIIYCLAILWSQHGELKSSFTLKTAGLPTIFELPADYQNVDQQSSWCSKHLGLDYLKQFSRESYCSKKSESSLTCFHSQTDKSGRIDSFCIAESATLDKSGTKFEISCNITEPPREGQTNKSSVPLAAISRYWYSTGPGVLLDNFVNITTEHLDLPSRNKNFTALIKREGIHNPWHSLMEIISLSMTFDILQISAGTEQDSRAFMTAEDAYNTQVIILDDAVDGPYFDLWRLFAKKPTIRLSELSSSADIGTIILPLPGASNPVWQGDWEANSCTHSALLKTFAKRVLKHFDISRSSNKDETNIVVSFIDRRGSRKLLDVEKHVGALKDRYAHVEIRLVDLAMLPLIEQIQIVRDSDVLAGVHGAGLTNGMWLKENSVLVEILPKEFMHKGFRNLAGAMDLGYFSTHGILSTEGIGGGDQNWQEDDVAIEEDRFLELMDIAIKSVYNRGSHNFDVNR